jgi:hypothetical protein
MKYAFPESGTVNLDPVEGKVWVANCLNCGYTIETTDPSITFFGWAHSMTKERDCQIEDKP